MVKQTAKTSGGDRLAEAQRILGLTQSETADIFKVRRATLARWQAEHVPVRRRATVERFYEFALVLRHEFLPSRIARIMRTPAAGLGERSILQVIQNEGVGPIYDYLERLFAYESA